MSGVRVAWAAVLLGACAHAPPPRLSPCAENVCLSWTRGQNEIAFAVENRNPVPVTLLADFPVRENLEPTAPIPIRTVIPAAQRIEPVRFSRADPLRADRIEATTLVHLGSVETIPDPAARYAIPFGGAEPRVLGQGVDGGITHKGVERYAFDWVMPIGTPVLAAREGIVVQVIDGFTKGGFDERLRTQWNLVVVGHADGTLASYGHLSKGIPVRIGDHVVRGQRLGLSGNTGYTQGPHLHFHVGKILDDQVEGYTVPIRFDDGSRDGFVPELGSRYGPEVEVAPVGSTRLR